MLVKIINIIHSEGSNMQKKSFIAHLILGSLVLGSASQSYAALSMPSAPSKKQMALAFLFASFMRLRYKKSQKDPAQRFEAKKLIQIDEILNKEYWENILYFFDDVWVGQRGKSSYYKIELDGDNPGIKSGSPDKPATGVCGTTLAYAGLALKSLDDVRDIVVAAALCSAVYNMNDKYNGKDGKDNNAKNYLKDLVDLLFGKDPVTSSN
jgi:hypothetical protein